MGGILKDFEIEVPRAVTGPAASASLGIYWKCKSLGPAPDLVKQNPLGGALRAVFI